MFKYKIRVLILPVIIVIIAVFISFVLLNMGNTSVNNVQVDAILNDLLTISTDLELQQETITKTAFSIGKQRVFKPSYVKAHKYHEVELLESFSAISKINSMSHNYFLIYRGEHDVYKADSGAKNTFEVFKIYYNIEDENGDLYDKLASVDSFTVIPYKSFSRQNCIFAVPVFTEGNLSGDIIATFGVLISNTELLDRYQTMVNSSYDNMYLFYDGSLIMTLSEDNLTSPEIGNVMIPENGGYSQLETDIERYYYSSNESKFQVVADINTKTNYSHIKTITNDNPLWIYTVLLILMIFSLLLGFFNYKPIRGFLNKYKLHDKSKSELDAIEHFVDNLISEKNFADQRIQEQYNTIKRQICGLILNGDDQWYSLASKSFIGIELTGPYYCVVAFHAGRVLTQDEESEFTKNVENYTGTGVNIFFSSTKYKELYAFILSIEDKNKVSDALDYIEDILLGRNINESKASPVFDNIRSFPENMAFAATSINVSGKHESDTESSEELSKFIDKMAELTVNAITQNKRSEALYYFNTLADDLHTAAPSILYERYIVHSLLHKVSESVKKSGKSVDPVQVNAILAAVEYEDIVRNFAKLVASICDDSGESHSMAAGRQNAKNILAYIDDHFMENGLSLDVLADQFGISTKSVSQKIKEATGTTYLAYVTDKRILYAQELLLSGKHNVTEVSSLVGYSNLPHFIKIFKRIVGTTPAEFIKDVANSDKSIE